MANDPISGLPALSGVPAPNDLVPIVHAGTTYSVMASAFGTSTTTSSVSAINGATGPRVSIIGGGNTVVLTNTLTNTITVSSVGGGSGGSSTLAGLSDLTTAGQSVGKFLGYAPETAAPTLVQQNSGVTGLNGTTVTLSLPSPTTSGNELIFIINGYDGGGGYPSVNSGFTTIASADGGTYNNLYAIYKKVSTGGDQTMSIVIPSAYTGRGGLNYWYFEYSGVASVSTPSVSTGTTTNSITVPVGSVAIAMFMLGGGTPSWTDYPGSSTYWTQGDVQTINSLFGSVSNTYSGSGGAGAGALYNAIFYLLGSSSVNYSFQYPTVAFETTASYAVPPMGSSGTISIAHQGLTAPSVIQISGGGSQPFVGLVTSVTSTSATVTTQQIGGANPIPSSSSGFLSGPPPAVIAGSTTFDQAVLATSGLSNYYPMNESSGSTVYDVKGGSNGTYTGTIIYNARGIPANDGELVPYFDGSTAYATLHDPTTSSTSFTWMCAFNLAAFAGGSGSVIFSNYTGAGGSTVYYAAGVSSGSVTGNFIQVAANGSATANLASIVNGWHLGFLVYNGTNYKVYLDGALIDTIATSTYTKGSGGWQVGAENGTTAPFAGYLGKAAIWGSTPLTQAQITALTTAFNTPNATQISSISTYDQIVLGTSGLQNYWPLNETSGTTAYDIKGTANGTYGGTYTQGLGIGNLTGVGLDGASGYVQLGSFTTPTFPFSIEFLLMTNQIGTYALWDNLNANTDTQGIAMSTGPIGSAAFASLVGTGSTYNAMSSGNMSYALQPLHIVMTADGAHLKQFVNGQLVATVANTTFNFGSLTTYLGKRNAGGTFYYLPGIMSRTALYNVALSQSTITQHYQAFAIPSIKLPYSTYDNNRLSISSLINYWPLNEASGTTAYDLKGSANGTYAGSGVTYGTNLGMLNGDIGVIFDGSTGNMHSTPTMPSPSAGFTLEWVAGNIFNSSGSGKSLVGSFNASVQNGFDINAISSIINGNAGGASLTALTSSLVTPAVYQLNIYHFVYTGTVANLYVNNILISTTTVASWTASNYLSIGCATVGGTLSGYLSGTYAKVALYNAALTDTQRGNALNDLHHL